MTSYQAWYQRLDELQDREDCSGEKLAWEIEDYCITMVKKKNAEKHTCDTDFHFDGCIHMATKKIKCSPQ